MTDAAVGGVDGARGAWVFARLGPDGASTELVGSSGTMSFSNTTLRCMLLPSRVSEYS